MTGDQRDPRRQDDSPEADRAWQRRRRMAEVFGDVLPETTRDERDDDRSSATERDRGDAWLRAQVPPHHG
jgi:hypothetical protein